MKANIKTAAIILGAFCMLPAFAGCAKDNDTGETQTLSQEAQSFEETRYTHTESATVYDIGSNSESESYESASVVESGSYTSMAEVSEYIHEFGHLPDNYITKKEAKALGWRSSEGNLSIVAPGKSIGGDSFGNREGLLPKQKGRKYFECDIDYTGGSRNAKRLIYSNDGLIYYTEDHYNTFEQIY